MKSRREIKVLCAVLTGFLAAAADRSLAEDLTFSTNGTSIVDLKIGNSGMVSGKYLHFRDDGSREAKGIEGSNVADGKLNLKFDDGNEVKLQKVGTKPGFVTWKVIDGSLPNDETSMSAPLFVTDEIPLEYTKKWRWSEKGTESLPDYKQYQEDKLKILKETFGPDFDDIAPRGEVGVIDRRRNFPRWELASSLTGADSLAISTFGDSEDRAMISVPNAVFSSSVIDNVLARLEQTTDNFQPQPLIYVPSSEVLEIPTENLFHEFYVGRHLSDRSWATFRQFFGRYDCLTHTPTNTALAMSCTYHSDDFNYSTDRYWLKSILFFRIGPYDDAKKQQIVYLEEETYSANRDKSERPKAGEFGQKYANNDTVKYCEKYFLAEIMATVSKVYPHMVREN